MSDKKYTIQLGGKGEAGTGIVTVPKTGTASQRLRFVETVRRRQGDPVQEKLDALKREQQKSFNFGSRKPGAGLVYQSEEDKGREAVRKFFEEADKRTPYDGDDTVSQSVDEAEATGDALTEGDISMEDFVADTGLPELKPGQKVVQSMGPDGKIISQIIDPPKPPKLSAADVNTDIYAEYIPGSEDMDPAQLREATLDAAAKQYGQKYENQQPVSASTVEFDGVEYVEEVYDDGAVFFVPTGEEGDYMRGKNKEV